jgi:two-component sensor histidine kinase
VDLGAYARRLAEQVLRTCAVPGLEIEFAPRVSPVLLSIDQAVPAGLILNELITNCARHAFPGRSRGRLELHVHADALHHCHVRLRDDGNGEVEGLDVETARTLGLRLVGLLARQLGGTVSLRRADPGAEALLAFRIERPPSPEPLS